MASCGDIEIASRPPFTPTISAILIMTIFDELEPYYARHLTGRELRQFRKAATAGASRLLTEIIQPNAYRPDRRSYMGVEARMDVAGRSPASSEFQPRRDLGRPPSGKSMGPIQANQIASACQVLSRKVAG